MTQIRISMNLNVVDEPLLRRLAAEAVAEHGMGIELDGSLSQAAFEVVIGSNPGVKGFLDYGVELINTELVDA